MNRKIEITVGLFMILVILSLLFIAFKMTDGTQFQKNNTYQIYAEFEDIGGLKPKSPIKIGGVVVGRVNQIELKDYKPYVSIDLFSQYDRIPSTSSLSIKTSGILGEQYIGVNLGLENDIGSELDELDALDKGIDVNDSVDHNASMPDYFGEGFVVHNTTSAIVLEDLIGKFLYNTSDSDKD